jgi:hypothetical protein
MHKPNSHRFALEVVLAFQQERHWHIVFEQRNMLVPILVAAATFAIVAFTPALFNDGDTYWHIAAGLRMIADRAVLVRDPFSYTFANAPWNAHEWLSEVLMAGAWRASGWGGVALLFAAAAGLSAGLLAWHLGRWYATFSQLAILILCLACTAGSLLARPHLLALPLLELWTAGLVIARSQRRAPSWFLLPVMTLWANMHGGFVFGFLMLFYAGLEAVFEERGSRRKTLVTWGLFAFGTLAAAALTPQFLDGLIFPFRLAGMTSLAHIGEWEPTSFATLHPFELVLLAAFYVFLSRGVKLPAGRVLICLLLLHLALEHMRHQVLFAIAVPLLLAEPLSQALGSRPEGGRMHPAIHVALASLAIAIVIGVSVVRLSYAFPRGGQNLTPQAALDHVPQTLAATPVLNAYGFGGYLIFRGVRPFIDSRAELYGDEFLDRYARIVAPDTKTLTQTMQKYRVGWTIFPPDSPVISVLDLLPGWRRTYSDSVAVVHVRDANPKR